MASNTSDGNISGKTILAFLWLRVKGQKTWLLLSLLFAFGTMLTAVQISALVKPFIDNGVIPKDMKLIMFICAALVGLIFLDGLFDFLHRFCLRIGVERTVRYLRNEIFDRFLIFSQAQSAKYTSGKAVNHVVNDVFVVSLGLHVMADIIHEPLMIVGLLGYLFYLNWQLTLVCLISLPLVAVLGGSFGKSARRSQTRIQEALEKISNHIVESVGGLRTAHAFGQTRQLRHEFEASTEEAYKHLVHLARVDEIVGPLTKWFTSIVGALIVGYGGYLVVHGQLSAGGLFAFLVTAGRLQQPLRQLNQVNVRMQQVIAAAKRLYEVANEPLDELAFAQEKALMAKPRAPAKADHAVPLEFKEVSFRYPFNVESEKRDWAVQELNLTLVPGKRLALVGRSGSGKTTLSLLAMRFIDPSKGTLLLDGKPAKSWDLGDYRAQFSHVSQDVFLFNRSIRENLLFANAKATDHEIWAALEKANIKEFVDKLPGKLNTNLGEHASRLSGGEKQRIAVARAFLRNSPIIVLDEATSQLDAHNEKAVQGALYELMENRSVLVIAHRLSTVREVDEVAVFDHGRVIELGRPETLLENPESPFAKLWQAQHGGLADLSL